MKAFNTPADLIDSIDDAKAHLINRAIFWPDRWKKFKPPAGIAWQWKSVPFQQSSKSTVPSNKHGIYSFVITPSVALHPKNHFILYIGKADRMSLRSRFQSYFQDMKRIKRPPICYALNKYFGHLEFCFTPIQKKADIEKVEDSLLAALLPPLNTDFPAEVSEVIRGLR